MNHEIFETFLPLYVTGQLNDAESADIEAHLQGCALCQADMELWQAVSGEIRKTNLNLAVPPDLARRTLKQVRTPSKLTLSFIRTWQLLHAQAYLVQREMWPMTAALMALGLAIALISRHAEFVYFLSPLVSAASLSMLSGPENDPAYELTIATATSPWKVLLARLSIVSAYNLLLTLAAIMVLMFFISPGLFGVMALGLFTSIAFLSALALLFSLWIGTSNAIFVTFVLWVAQFVPHQFVGQWMVSPLWSKVIPAYQQFWQTPMLLLFLSILLFVLALWSINRPVFRLNQEPG